ALKKNGRKIDAIIAHHPEGKAYARFYEVMKMQSDIFSAAGVPINIVEDLTAERMSEVARRVAPANHERAVDAARLLDVPFMCVHTPADNHVASYLSKLFAEKKPEFLDDVVKILKDIPEYRAATQAGSGPNVLVGDKSRRAGRVLVDMTGGTEGSKDIFNSLATSGVGTVVAMHLSEDHYKKAKENRVNIVVAGHISSDNLGLNLLFDALKIGGIALDIVPCSGFRRFSRVS
ncbi:MAG: NGG1p interacting factor NIF3, partial [Endomicrobiia bacterium]|nr:NGG1p interacting factor NIF3 [Endomicrobiia bacterium]